MSENKGSAKGLVAILAIGAIMVGASALLKNDGISLPSGSEDSGPVQMRNIIGSKKAPIELIEYSDAECPFCGRFHTQTFPSIKKDYIDTGKVSFSYKHLPLPFHPNAQKAGEAIECAAKEGKQLEYMDVVYANQKALSVDNLKSYAADLSIDIADCLDSGKMASVVTADMEEAKSFGISGTPAFMVNGIKVVGAQPYQNFKSIFDTILSGDKAEIAKLVEASKPKAPEAPSNDPVDVDAGTSVFMGDANAPVEIIEFSDFECPFCKRLADNALVDVKKDYIDTGKVKLAFRDFPLPFHKKAQKAAEAAKCAADQGKFWEMHDAIFANSPNMAVSDLKTMAVDMGINIDSCLDSGEKEQDVKDDLEAGKAAGVTGTPVLFINGIPVRGAQPYENIKKVIEAELAK
jgi:protein-disulfide isomerase